MKKGILKKNEEIEEVKKTESGRQRIFGALIGDGVCDDECRAEMWNAALEYCRIAMKRRNGIVLKLLDQRT